MLHTGENLFWNDHPENLTEGVYDAGNIRNIIKYRESGKVNISWRWKELEEQQMRGRDIKGATREMAEEATNVKESERERHQILISREPSILRWPPVLRSGKRI